MLKTYDVGSLPLSVDEYTIKQGANRITTIIPLVDSSDQSSKVLENEIVDAFKDKIRAGIDIPNYPQFRDMNEMYFELLKGIEKKDDGYTALISPLAKPGRAVPE